MSTYHDVTDMDMDYEAAVDLDDASEQWFAFFEQAVPGAVLVGCADERPDIPKRDPSSGGVVYLTVTWEKLAELHAAIGEVLTRRPA